MKSGKKSREKLKLARLSDSTKFKQSKLLLDNQIIAERIEHDFRQTGLAVNTLQTVFHVREAQYEVDKRINQTRQPLINITTSNIDQLQYYTSDNIISMPIRPQWNNAITAEQLKLNEQSYFDDWLHTIYQKHTPYQLNHFEHNLDVWRQLWRTVESSDILCVCIDSRHPLFHYPPSLHHYITQIHKKQIIIVMNKIDLITESQLQQWLQYFNTGYTNIIIIPFTSYPNNTSTGALPIDNNHSAKQQKQNKRANWRPLGTQALMNEFDIVLQNKLSQQSSAVHQSDQHEHQHDNDSNDSINNDIDDINFDKLTINESKHDPSGTSPVQYSSIDAELAAEDSAYKQKMQQVIAKRKAKKAAKTRAKERRKQHIGDISDDDVDVDDNKTVRNIVDWRKADDRSHIDNNNDDTDTGTDNDNELPSWSKQTKLLSDRSKVIRVGLLGHPNAGKSSVLNALLNRHATSVSETPGKTKHMQTFNLTQSIELADSPGLVFPASTMPKQLQCICGLFPLKQLREPYSSVQYVAERVDLVNIYQLQPPVDDNTMMNHNNYNNSNKSHKNNSDDTTDTFTELNDIIDSYQWSAWDICESYARKHNMRVSGSKGVYDTHRAAIQILQDTFNGVVVLAFDPPPQHAFKQLDQNARIKSITS